MVRKVFALPPHVRLIASLVIRAADFDLVDRVGPQHLRQSAEVLRRDAPASTADRTGWAPAVVEIGVELRRTTDDAHLRCELPVDALGCRVLLLRIRDLPIQPRVRTVGVEGPWLVLEFVRGEKVQPVAKDRSTYGRTELLI